MWWNMACAWIKLNFSVLKLSEIKFFSFAKDFLCKISVDEWFLSFELWLVFAPYEIYLKKLATVSVLETSFLTNIKRILLVAN